ncbi:MAG: hypothetical protein MJZ84_07670 [Paludibacteraceae bacterium]|nr:hypothetical protein [Paludibacteraceae bacterium]
MILGKICIKSVEIFAYLIFFLYLCVAKRKIDTDMISSAVQKTTQIGLNPMQLHLVSMLNFNSTEAAEQRLKLALEQFYLSEFNQMKEQLFASGELTETVIAEGAARHFRTAY